jgi:GDP-4-dehydro-6-deoxy-D-mannose reductase
MTRATVTGAGGFVGPHLVAHLRASGDDVTEMDLLGPVEIDVTDAESTLNRIDAARPDVVYHLAALSHVGQSWTSPGRSFRVNAEGTLHVLRACLETGVSRVVVVLSSEVYGNASGDAPLREDAPLRPVTPYGASKAAADLVALQMHLADRLDVVRIRPFGHTGPGQSDQFVVPALAARIARAERDGMDEIPVGSLDAVRDLSDVRDVVRAYRLLALEGAAGEAYNVCSGVGVSIRDVAELLLAHATREIRLVTDPALVRAVDAPRMVGDNAKLRDRTGWAPDFTLVQTLADVLGAARVTAALEPST